MTFLGASGADDQTHAHRGAQRSGTSAALLTMFLGKRNAARRNRAHALRRQGASGERRLNRSGTEQRSFRGNAKGSSPSCNRPQRRQRGQAHPAQVAPSYVNADTTRPSNGRELADRRLRLGYGPRGLGIVFRRET